MRAPRTAVVAAAAVLLLASCGGDDAIGAPAQSVPRATSDKAPCVLTENDDPELWAVLKAFGLEDGASDVISVSIVDDRGTLEAQATFVNSASVDSDYYISICVESPDGAVRYGRSGLAYNGVEAGETVTTAGEIRSDPGTTVPPDAVARLIEVQRTPSQ